MKNDTQNTQTAYDPLAGWKFISILIISTAISFICTKYGNYFVTGICIFIQAATFTSGLLNNNFRKTVGSILLFFLYLILLNSRNLLDAQTTKLLSGENLNSENMKIWQDIFFTLYFFCVIPVALLTAKVFPKIKIPQNIHKWLQIAIFSCSLAGLVTIVNIAIGYFDGKIISLSGNFKIIFYITVIFVAVLALIKMIKTTLNPQPLENQSSGTAAQKTKVSADNSEKVNSNTSLLEERPTTKLADVAGMDAVKDQIRLRLIEPLRNTKLAQKYGLKTGGGVMLYGPPGTGKTFLARAVAGELDLPFYMITAADVFGRYVGDSEKNIRNLFVNARKNPLSVVFVDEMETIFSKRTDNIHETTQKVISVILQELDGVDQNKNPILLLGATNTPWKIDEAFLRPGRFDILAFVDLPDYTARLFMIKNAFRKSTLPCETGLAEFIAKNTEKYSGADLNGVISKIRQKAFDQRATFFSGAIAAEVLQESSPSINHEILAQIREWEKTKTL